MNDDKKTVKIVNIKQVCKYIENGIKPIDIFYTDRLVYVFDKKSTEDLFNKWINYEL